MKKQNKEEIKPKLQDKYLELSSHGVAEKMPEHSREALHKNGNEVITSSVLL